LTGLPNRALLLDRLTQTLARAEREQRPSAVLFLNLDRFKAINDSLGHAVGDELLRQAAERLRTAIRKEDTVARIGGDEFVILMAEIGDAENTAGIASKVLAALRVPFVIEEHELSVSASCGIAISPADGTQAAVLLQRADTALYQCKADGGGGYRLFDREIDRRAHARLQLEQGSGAPSSLGNSSCTIKHRSTSRAAQSRGPKHSCVGSTPRAGSCPLGNSFH
jgi:diguanylate cyclase (GGDEF)-like protein